MSITLDPELEEQVRRSAELRGHALNDEVARLLRETLSWEERERQEAIDAIQRGLDAANAGRVRPAAEFFAELEKKYPHLAE
jgi:predicted transcriptional regulator